MNDLLDQNLETVRLTDTVKHDGQYHGPGYVVAAPRAQTDAWIAAGKAEAYKPRAWAKAVDKTEAPDLSVATVRDMVKIAMMKLPNDADHFTNSGKPEIKAVIAALADDLPGLELSAADRDNLWEQAQAEDAGKGSADE